MSDSTGLLPGAPDRCLSFLSPYPHEPIACFHPILHPFAAHRTVCSGNRPIHHSRLSHTQRCIRSFCRIGRRSADCGRWMQFPRYSRGRRRTESILRCDLCHRAYTRFGDMEPSLHPTRTHCLRSYRNHFQGNCVHRWTKRTRTTNQCLATRCRRTPHALAFPPCTGR